MAQRLGKRAVDVCCDVENSVLTGRCIEPIVTGAAEENRIAINPMDTDPGGTGLLERQRAVG
jgi:hypothetical protein